MSILLVLWPNIGGNITLSPQHKLIIEGHVPGFGACGLWHPAQWRWWHRRVLCIVNRVVYFAVSFCKLHRVSIIVCVWSYVLQCAGKSLHSRVPTTVGCCSSNVSGVAEHISVYSRFDVCSVLRPLYYLRRLLSFQSFIFWSRILLIMHSTPAIWSMHLMNEIGQ